jgi:cysteine synthase A
MGMGKDLRVVLADPEGSGLFNKIKYGVMFSNTEREGTRRRQQVDTIVEGIGINRITENFEAGRELIDDAVKVSDLQAMKMARWLVEKDGIFVGSSSAVNCVAAVVTALQLPMDSRVVTILCDSGTRHLSKFWKKVGEMGLEEEHDQANLFTLLDIKDAR